MFVILGTLGHGRISRNDTMEEDTEVSRLCRLSKISHNGHLAL